ncbi:hypothetical protein CEUSTIGMA_g774.t1 [Chlamydomonas eustigma]|uniref:Probable pectate lyase C n=1 Tax=Chlamydomonas eustigma TaxID=1157962 RepID=A0A250WS02_9CHLO|nr:hypothetical protein CEUSTIGMA_g774.t1 [Chlamydomonas eustigma]|eukprot:GAX73320.1 hypothetical protein CEUSTIGMA_g774.t1 [Chlamydomonas eustigma]
MLFSISAYELVHKALVLGLAITYLSVQRAIALSRPYCENGDILCRGSTSAISRFDHAAVPNNDGLVYILGGRTSDKSSAYILSSTSYAERWDLTSNVVVPLTLGNYQNITARAGHSMVFSTSSGTTSDLIVFGGQAYDYTGLSTETLNDVQLIDLNNQLWVTYFPSSATSGPPRRQYAAATMSGAIANSQRIHPSLVIMGGSTSGIGVGQLLNDVWSFNLESMIWTQISVKSTPIGTPCVRGKATAYAINADFLLVFGGFTQTYSNYTYPPPSPPPPNPSPPPRPPPPSVGRHLHSSGEESVDYETQQSKEETGVGINMKSRRLQQEQILSVNTGNDESQPELINTTLLNDLWALDMRSSPATWYKIQLSPTSGQNANMIAGGWDLTNDYNQATDTWRIIVSGGYTYPLYSSLETEWSQWVATYDIANISSLLYSGVAAVAAGTYTLTATVSRTALYKGTAPTVPSGTGVSTTLVNSDGSSIDLTSGAVYSYASSSTLSNPFVYRSAVAYNGSGSGSILVNGGMYTYSGDSQAVSNSVYMNLRSPSGAQSLDVSLKPSSSSQTYFYSSSNSVILRSMTRLLLPTSGSSTSANQAEALAFYGSYDTSAVGTPDLGVLYISDVTNLNKPFSCGTAPTTSSSCQSVQLGASVTPVNRNYYTSVSLLGQYAGTVGNGSNFNYTAALIMVYGGRQVSGGSLPSTAVAVNTKTGTLTTILETCDTSNLFTAAQAASLSSCAYSLISSQVCSSSTIGRRLLGAAEEVKQYEEEMSASQPYHHGTEGTLFPDGAAKQRRSLSSTTASYTYFDTALIALVQTTDIIALQSRRDGPSIVWTTAQNLIGGTTFSPGARYASASYTLGTRDLIVVGGVATDLTSSNPSAGLSLSIDIHYMRLYIGGETVSNADFTLQPCIGSGASGYSCTSASPYPYTSYTLPSVAPVPTTSTVTPQPTSALNFCCNAGTTYFMSVTFSSSLNVVQGFKIIDWETGNTVLNSASIAGFSSTQTSPLCPNPPSNKVQWCGYISLPSAGLFQLVLTSDNGNGWIGSADVASPFTSCCVPSSGTATGTSCCPSVTLTSSNCSSSNTVFYTYNTIWDTRSTLTYTYSYAYGFSLCGANSIPSSSNILYPFEQRGHYMHSFEVQPNTASLLPAARRGHAVCYLSTALGLSHFGGQVIAMFGGTTSINATNATAMLNDLWIFMTYNHTWVKITPTTTVVPPAQQGLAMTCSGTEVFVSGGEYYDSSTQAWKVDNTVYAMDISISTDFVWRVLSGGENIQSSSYQLTAHTTSMATMSTYDTLSLLTATDLFFVPVPGKLDISCSLTGNAASLDSNGFSTLIEFLYDGDIVIFTSCVESVTIQSTGLPIYPHAGLFMQGDLISGSSLNETSATAGTLPSSSPSPSSTSNPASNPSSSNSPSSTSSSSVSGRRSVLSSFDPSLAESNNGFYHAERLLGSYEDSSVVWSGRDQGGRKGPKRLQASPSSDPHSADSSFSRKELQEREALTSILLPSVNDIRLDEAAGGMVLDVGEVEGRIQRHLMQIDGESTVSDVKRVGRSRRHLLYANVSYYTALTTLTTIDCQGYDYGMIISSAGTSISNFYFRNCAQAAILINASMTAADTQIRITNCIFANNKGALGGAIRIANSANVTITNSFFVANQGVYGGAIYVEAGAALSISSSIFDGNGYAGLTIAGGAIYVNNSGCLSYITTSSFLGNGGSSNLTSGGAVFISNPSCSPTITSSTFYNNSAALYGGAITLQYFSSSYTTVISESSFTSNHVGLDYVAPSTASLATGGALFAQNMYGTLALQNCTFSSNTAKRAGGAVATVSAQTVTASYCYFYNNSVSLLQGGAWDFEREGSLTISSSSFVKNYALYGGAFSGGDHARKVYVAHIISCVFSGNSAGSAGAVSLNSDTTASSVTNCNFTGNNATSSVYEAGCSRTSTGGGGAFCMVVQSTISIYNSFFNSNTATNGGGIWVYQTCSSATDATCGALNLTESVLSNNIASAGGGAIYVYQTNMMSYSCPGEPKTVYTGSQLITGCSTWTGNSADYGSTIATAATALVLDSPSSGIVDTYLSASYLSIRIHVMDAFIQIISKGSIDARASLTAASADGNVQYTPAGVTIVAAINGLVSYNNLYLQAAPGSYNLSFTAAGTTYTLPSVTVVIQVRHCYVGEVTNTANDLCTVCSGDTQFSFSSLNTSCDTCPSNAICSYDKYTTNASSSKTVESSIGSILVPADGYWHSSPWSPQVQLCPNTDSCTYTNRKAIILSFQEEVYNSTIPLFLSNGTLSPLTTTTDYQDILCAAGYYSTLCGACLPGYGRTAVATCKACPGAAENTIYYILIACFDLVMIFITIRAQLTGEDVEAPVVADTNQGGGKQQVGLAESSTLQIREDKDDCSSAPAAESKGPVDVRPANGGGMLEAVPVDVVFLKAQRAKEADLKNVQKSKLGSAPHSVVIKILVSYLQVAAILKNINLQWPSFVNNLLTAMKQIDSSSGSAVSLDCSLAFSAPPKSLQTTVISVGSPIVVMILSLPIWLGLYVAGKKAGNMVESFHEYMRFRLTITVISVIFYYYPGVTTSLLSIFSCQNVDNNSVDLPYYQNVLNVGQYWSYDYNLKCYEGYHLVAVMALGVPGVICFCLGVPAFSFYFMWRNKHRLYQQGFLRAYGFIYSDYRDGAYYWETVVLLRKFLIVLVVVFLLPAGAQMQVLVALGVIIVAMVLQMVMMPFRLSRMEGLERFALYGNTIGLYVGMFLITTSSTGVKIGMSAVLVTVNSIIIAFLVLMIVKEYFFNFAAQLDLDKDGWLSEEEVNKALETSGLLNQISIKGFAAFYFWVKKNPARERLWANFMPYSMFGERPSDEDLASRGKSWIDKLSISARERESGSGDKAMDAAAGTAGALEPPAKILSYAGGSGYNKVAPLPPPKHAIVDSGLAAVSQDQNMLYMEAEDGQKILPPSGGRPAGEETEQAVSVDESEDVLGGQDMQPAIPRMLSAEVAREIAVLPESTTPPISPR